MQRTDETLSKERQFIEMMSFRQFINEIEAAEPLLGEAGKGKKKNKKISKEGGLDQMNYRGAPNPKTQNITRDVGQVI